MRSMDDQMWARLSNIYIDYIEYEFARRWLAMSKWRPLN